MVKNKKYTWKTVPMKDIPQGIRTYLDKRFNSDVVFGIVKEEHENNAFYVIDVDHNGMLHHLKFDQSGNFVSEKIEVTAESDGEHFTTVGGGG